MSNGAAFNAGTLQAFLLLKKDQHDKALAESEKKQIGFGKQIEKNSQKLKIMGTAMTIAGGLILAGFAKIAKSASMAAEVSSKFAFTFRDIKDESSKALKDLVNNYGMSVVSGQKLLASTGDIYKGFGANSEKALGLSLSIQKLAADHTSFNNVQGGVARASEIITKATLGEREGLIQLGMKVSEQMVMERLALQGKEKLAGAALFLAKSEATLALITEQSGGAIGDYGRTAGSTANQARLFTQRIEDLKVMIGTHLLPVITPLITGMVNIIKGLSDWAKEHPGLTKGILLTVGAIGTLSFVMGPIVAFLPKIVKGYAALKAIMTATVPIITANANAIAGLIPTHTAIRVNKLGMQMKGLAKNIGKAALAGGVFVATFTLTKAIAEVTGLNKAIQKGLDLLMPTLKFYEKLSMMKMGFTEKGEQALFLRNQLIDLAKALDPDANNLRAAARVLRENETAYKNLHPALKRIVDGMTQLRPAIQGVIDKGNEIPTQTEAQRTALEGILAASATRIRELTMTETAFKIEQLNIEHAKNIEMFNLNGATKEQLQLLERAHTLEIAKIRDEAYKAQKEKDDKRALELKKAKELGKKKKEEEIKKEEERQQKHFSFMEGLKKEQQNLILRNIEERDGWRVAELTRLQIWEDDQFKQLVDRLANELITFQEYQEQKTAILETGEMKRFEIEEKARKESEKLEREKMDRIMAKVAATINKMAGKYQWFVGTLGNYFTAMTQTRENELNAWYDSELKRINESSMSNEERALAIEGLDAAMHRKKAELEAASAKRERFLAIANAIGNTAVAITKAMTIAPWPFNLPAIIFAGVTGAAQIRAIGGAYKTPGVGDFAPPGEGGGTSPGGGGGEGGGLGTGTETFGGGGKGPAFQHGTNGYITPPQDFTVGEPYSTEQVRLRGDLQNVGMSITPLGQTPAASGANINFNFAGMQVRDATDFENQMREFIPEFVQQLFYALRLKVPRSQVQ
jgi:hypothetical protein